MLPSWNPESLIGVSTAEDGFVHIPNYNIAPTVTAQDGIFATGTAIGPMDIVDSIVTASAAAAEAAAYIQSHNGCETAAIEDTRNVIHG
jgi:heterodisulfide reductase subunit A-like polyferredoxin